MTYHEYVAEKKSKNRIVMAIIITALLLFLTASFSTRTSSEYTIGGPCDYATLSFDDLNCIIVFSDLEWPSSSTSRNRFPLSGLWLSNTENYGYEHSFGHELEYKFRYNPIFSRTRWTLNEHEIIVSKSGKKVTVNGREFEIEKNQPLILIVAGDKVIPVHALEPTSEIIAEALETEQ